MSENISPIPFRIIMCMKITLSMEKFSKASEGRQQQRVKADLRHF